MPAPSETGICRWHAKQAKKPGATIRKLSRTDQVKRLWYRQPEQELEAEA
jgi:hypothetical protein